MTKTTKPIIDKMIKFISIFLLTLSLTAAAYSHGGGTNANGCHTQRSTGGYHCHNPKGYQNSYRQNYCHVYRGEYRCGYARSSCNQLQSYYGGYCTAQ